MSLWNNHKITNVGLSLIAQAQAESKVITITNFKSSSHEYQASDLATLTDLSDIEQTIAITEKQAENNVVKVRTNVTNDGVATQYTFRTFGIYGHISSESDVLLMVAIDSMPDIVPAISEGLWESVYNINIPISNTSTVTINVDYSAMATQQWVLDHLPPQHEFIITMPTDTTQYETITDTASKTYYKYTYTNVEVKNKFSVRDIYLGTETLLDNIDNMESEYSNVIKVVCLVGSIEVYIKEIPTNTFYIKVAQ